jgi:hypothetical protein
MIRVAQASVRRGPAAKPKSPERARLDDGAASLESAGDREHSCQHDAEDDLNHPSR